MRVELTAEQAAAVRPLIRQCDVDSLTPRVVMGQLMPGDWKAPAKVWLIYTTISVATAKKVRKMIEKERAQSAPVALEKKIAAARCG